MFSPTKWVQSVVATVAIVVVIAGASYLIGRSTSGPATQPQRSSVARAPDPETTSSILKMMDSSSPLTASKP